MKLINEPDRFLIALLLLTAGMLNLFPVAIAGSLETESGQQNNLSEVAEPPQQLLQRALLLKDEGKLNQALVKLSEAYGEENILTDGYYDLLNRTRVAILRDITSAFPDETTTLNSFQILYDKLCSRPNRGPAETDLPFERYLNFEIIQMGEKRDIQALLDSPDPWIISTVLFLSRKGELEIDPVGVIARWEGRPDLWDSVCDDQAMAYLVTLEPGILETLSINNEDIKMAVKKILSSNTELLPAILPHVQ